MPSPGTRHTASVSERYVQGPPGGVVGKYLEQEYRKAGAKEELADIDR